MRIDVQADSLDEKNVLLVSRRGDQPIIGCRFGVAGGSGVILWDGPDRSLRAALRRALELLDNYDQQQFAKAVREKMPEVRWE